MINDLNGNSFENKTKSVDQQTLCFIFKSVQIKQFGHVHL